MQKAKSNTGHEIHCITPKS